MMLIGIMCFIGSIQNRADTAGPYTYNATNGVATITRFSTTYAGSLTVTNTLGGCPVNTIGPSAFSSCSNLTSVILPETLTTISKSAFSFYSNMISITIPASVTQLDEGGAFYNCSVLTNIAVDAGNAFYSSLDGVLFNKSKSVLFRYPAGIPGGYEVPGTVTIIDSSAFRSCSRLPDIAIPSSVTNIGSYAFSGCSGLARVTIPSSVTNIGTYALSYCTNLTSVLFSGNAPVLVIDAFAVSTNVTVYYLPDTTGWSSTFGGRPAVLWNPAIGAGGFGFGSDGFNFDITGATNSPVTVEACTNLSVNKWLPLQTTVLTNGTITFRDPDSTNYPGRFYRIAAP